MLRKISIDQVRQGMYINSLCGSWFDNPFWATSFLLSEITDLRRLQASGVQELWIDTCKGDDVVIKESTAEVGNPADEVSTRVEETPAPALFKFAVDSPVGIKDELSRAERILKKSREVVGAMFEDVRMGRIASATEALPLVDEIASSVLRNSGALVSLVRLKQADDYTYMHSVAVCAMMISVAKQMNESDQLVREYGLAGLLHDIGKMAIPVAILNKPGRLTDEEFMIVKGHPSAGYDMLKSLARMPEVVLDVCLHHHERMDGNGYPDRHGALVLSQAARVAAICDVYDAVTSNRPYKKGWSPTESLRKMALWAKEGHFDQTLFATFVKCIGIYPIGTLVRLKSNRLAVVIDNGASLLRPTIRVFFSLTSMTYLPVFTINLGREGGSEEIISTEEPQKWNIQNINRYWTEQ